MLTVHDIADHLLIEDHKKIDDIKNWPVLFWEIYLDIFCRKNVQQGLHCEL